MRFQTTAFLAITVLLGVGPIFSACAAPEELETSPRTLEPTTEAIVAELPAWTEEFRSPALLMANRVTIEGPKGLVDHVATRLEPRFHGYAAETLPEGFRQVITSLEPGAGIEIRAYLDAFQVVAFEELVLLERPGQVDVIVRAEGDAYYRDTTSGAEQRGSRLEFRGVVER